MYNALNVLKAAKFSREKGYLSCMNFTSIKVDLYLDVRERMSMKRREEQGAESQGRPS